MKQKIVSAFLPFLLFLGIQNYSIAQIPGAITWQGMIEGVSGSADLVFRLYPSSVGGTLLWMENHRAVELNKDGVVSIVLGSKQSLDKIPFDRPYWLEIALNGNIITPRTQLTSSPYTHRSEIANSVTDGSIQPNDLNTDGTTPSDGEIVTYNATTGNFSWKTSASDGGAINQLVEGNGIQIDGLSGPISTISIAADGVNTSMLADGSVTGQKIAHETIVTDNVADKSITQEKFADGVGLPNIGTAGGDLKGNYPNPEIADGVVAETHFESGAVSSRAIADNAVTSDQIADDAVNSEHVNSNAHLQVSQVTTTGAIAGASIAVAGTGEFSGNVGVGTPPAVTSPRMHIMGSGATATTSSLSITDNSNPPSPLFFVRNDGTIGVGTNTPTAAINIVRPAGVGLYVQAGSSAFSYGSIVARANVVVPPNTTVFEVTPDGVQGSGNAVKFPNVGNRGELLILINRDDDPLTIAGGPPVVAGQSAIYVFLPTTGRWFRIN